jgi:hypothetical protein
VVLHIWFLIGFLFNPEDGGDIFYETLDEFYQIARRYVPEDITLHSHVHPSLLVS